MQQGMPTGLADLYNQRDLCACVLQVGTHSGVLKACRPSDKGHLSVLKIQHYIIMTQMYENLQLTSPLLHTIEGQMVDIESDGWLIVNEQMIVNVSYIN